MTGSAVLGNGMNYLKMMEEIQDDNEKLLAEKEELAEANRHYREELEQMQTRLKSAEADISNLKQEKEDILTECRETLDRQKSEAQEKISELSSQNSVLQSELRKKSGTILSLNEQIGRLSESDIVLKQNEELKRQNNQLEQEMSEVREAAEKKEEDAEKRVADALREADSKVEAVRETEKSVNAMKEDVERFINLKAVEMFAEVQGRLEGRFKAKESLLSAKYLAKVGAVYGYAIAVMLYGIAVTVMMVLRSDRLMADGIAFATLIRDVFGRIFGVASNLAKSLSNVSGDIPNHLLMIVVSVILTVLSYVVVIGGVVGLSGFVLYRIGRFYYRFFWDKVSLAVTLTELILIVWGADVIGKWMSWNMLLLLICVQAVYVFVRMVVTRDRH